MMLCSVRRPFLKALYSHLEYHINRQSELMTTDQNITKEMKRELYIKSVCERAAEHSSLPANNRTFERQFSDQEDLLNSLDERCSHAISDLQAEEGGQRWVWYRFVGVRNKYLSRYLISRSSCRYSCIYFVVTIREQITPCL